MQTVSSKRVLGGASMAIAMALLLAAIALTSRTALAVNHSVVAQDNLQFSDELVEATVGDQIIWGHTGTLPHDATAANGASFPTITLNSNDDVGAWQLTEAGTFFFYCSVHFPGGSAGVDDADIAGGAMAGKIVVAQQTTATATTTTATATATTATATATATTATATATTPATNTPTSTPTATATVPAATATSPATTTAVAPGPPDTGTGTVSGTNNALLLAAAGLVALGLAGGSLVAIRRRA